MSAINQGKPWEEGEKEGETEGEKFFAPTLYFELLPGPLDY